MVSKKTIKTDAITMPNDKEEAEAWLLRVGKLQNEVQRIEADMNDKIAKLKAQYQDKANDVNEEIQRKFKGIHAFAEANKTDLLDGKAKTAKLSSGELSWRKSTPSVSIRKQLEVIDALKAAGMTDLIRTKEEVNKDAILSSDENKARASSIKGINISQKETFSIKPFSTEIECVETVTSSKKAAA